MNITQHACNYAMLRFTQLAINQMPTAHFSEATRSAPLAPNRSSTQVMLANAQRAVKVAIEKGEEKTLKLLKP
jgi:ABC-type proline/glycine betaine transport system permease subunit